MVERANPPKSASVCGRMAMPAAIFALLANMALALSAFAQPVVRAEQRVVVQGVAETWRLVWESQPKPECGADDIDRATTCPCWGFAYGESGAMSLVRLRNGQEIDRLNLDRFFGYSDFTDRRGSTTLASRPTELDDWKRERAGDTTLQADIARRPLVPVFEMDAYAGGKEATQFLLQIDSGPCGHGSYVAVGVTKKRPKLHALTSVAYPKWPLILERQAWRALASGPGRHRVVEWACGDHGSDVRRELVLSAINGQIDVKRREYPCADDAGSGNSIPKTHK